MLKQVLGLSLLCGMFCLPQLASARNNANKQFAITITIGEMAVDGTRRKVLANPTIVTKLDRSFAFHAGGTVVPKRGVGELEIGTRVSGALRRSGEGALQAELIIALADHHESDAATDLVLTESLEVRTLLTPGQTKRLDWGESRWCEIRIEEYDLASLGGPHLDLEEGDLVTIVFPGPKPFLVRDLRAEAAGLSPYRLTARVGKALPDRVYEIVAAQKTVWEGTQRSVRLTGRVPSASVSDKHTVPLNAIANLRIEMREE